jgi:Protein of unknown function (DUF3619)
MSTEKFQEDIKARQIVQLLDESVSKLDVDVTSKLASSRQQAVYLLSQRSVMTAQGKNGVLHMFGDYFQHHRAMMSAGILLGAILFAFLITQQLTNQQALEQGDAFLLGEELPPEAFLDQGFTTWIEQNK